MFKANLEIKAKAEEILKDRDTKEWLVTIGSDSARINYHKHVAEYLLYRKLSIQQLISNFKNDQLKETKKLQEFINQMLKTKAPGSVANYDSAIKSRLRYDGITLTRKIIIPNRTFHPTVANQMVPTKDQIITILRSAKPDTQAIAVLEAFSGFRFKVMSDLRISDFPEMRIKGKEVIFEKMPTLIKVRRELSKNKRPYQTFLIELGCVVLKNALQIRLQKGEQLGLDSYIIPVDCDPSNLTQRSKDVSRRLNTVFDKIGYSSRPYSLKDYFATALMSSQIQQNLQTFFMGHSGPVQNEYSLMRQLPADQIEKLRSIFKEQIEPNLVPQDSDANRIVNHHFKEFAKKLGLEVKEDESTEQTIAEIAEVYKAGIMDLGKRENPPPLQQQKRINEKELDKYLADDWDVSHELKNGDFIIKKTVAS